MKSSKALILNALAAGGGQVSSIGYRIVQVPMLIAALGVEDYGRWLIIYSFPSLLMMANLGFGTVAANYLAVHHAAGEHDAARRIYSTGMALTLGLCSLIFLVAVTVSVLVPWHVIVQAAPGTESELRNCILLLVAAVLLMFPCDLMAGRLRAARKAHQSLTLAALRPWVELFLLAVLVYWQPHFLSVALAVFFASVAYLVATWVLSSRVLPEARWSVAHISRSEVSRLFGKGLSFQALGMGNALLQQGNLMAIQAALGASAVAQFGTARTLVTAVVQALGMINTVTWPEFSRFFGQRDYVRAARLHRLGTLITLGAGLAGWLFILTVGVPFYRWWTHGAIDMSFVLIFLFSLPIPLTAFYACSAGIHTACNQHEGLAMRFMLGTGLSVLACYFCARHFGIEAAAATSIIVNLVSIRQAMGKAIELTHDTPRDFVRGMCHELRNFPSMLRRISLNR